MPQTTNKLVVTLPSDLEILLTREFEAPRELVFEAFTRCEHIRHWWAPWDMEISQCESDFRVGGGWRMVLRQPDGSEHPFKGSYLTIAPPESFARTFIYDVDFIRDHPATETATFEELGGRTRVSVNVRHLTKEARDGHLQSGMEPGAADAYDKLEAYLRSLRSERGS
jgi:uncharacterized protein YndB with AHSA1/START domain